MLLDLRIEPATARARRVARVRIATLDGCYRTTLQMPILTGVEHVKLYKLIYNYTTSNIPSL